MSVRGCRLSWMGTRPLSSALRTLTSRGLGSDNPACRPNATRSVPPLLKMKSTCPEHTVLSGVNLAYSGRFPPKCLTIKLKDVRIHWGKRPRSCPCRHAHGVESPADGERPSFEAPISDPPTRSGFPASGAQTALPLPRTVRHGPASLSHVTTRPPDKRRLAADNASRTLLAPAPAGKMRLVGAVSSGR